jgi:hypothetical protein
VSNCNTILPLCCMLGIPEIYYVVGSGYFLLGVWLSRKIVKMTINDLILSLHTLLFHFFFMIMAIFGPQNLFIKHNCAMMCAIIMLVGAVH